MPDAHALLSPSASHRWLHCTPCAVLESKIPSKDTIFTREGTLAHSIGETLLKEYMNKPTDTTLTELRQTCEAEGYDFNEMRAYVQAGYVDRIITEYESVKETSDSATLLIEEKVRMQPWASDCWGTSDAIIISNGTIHVCDLKYGRGVKVDAKDNPQMMLYALGAYEEFGSWLYEVKHIQMSIYQPRLNHWSTATMELTELLQWAEDVVKPKSELAAKGFGSLEPGSWCRFCRCSAQCKALAELSIKAAEESFEPQMMTDEEISHSLEMLSIVQAWCNSVSEYALRAMTEDARVIPGWKVVEGVSRSKITDTEGAAQALQARGYEDAEIYQPQTLKGLTELKKLLGKKAFETILTPFITKQQGKPTVVPETDPRPAIGQENPADIFANVL